MLITPSKEQFHQSSIQKIQANVTRLLGRSCEPQAALQAVMRAFIDFWTVMHDRMHVDKNTGRNPTPDTPERHTDASTPQLLRPFAAAVEGIAKACFKHAGAWTPGQRVCALYLTAAAAIAVAVRTPGHGHGRDRGAAGRAVRQIAADLKPWFSVREGDQQLLGRDGSTGAAIEGCMAGLQQRLSRARAADGCGGREGGGGGEALVTDAVWEMFTRLCQQAQQELRASVSADTQRRLPHGAVPARPTCATGLATHVPGPVPVRPPAEPREAVAAAGARPDGVAATPRPTPHMDSPAGGLHTAAAPPLERVQTPPANLSAMPQARAIAAESRGQQPGGATTSSNLQPAGAISNRPSRKRGRGDACEQDPAAKERAAKAFREFAPAAPPSTGLLETLPGEQPGPAAPAAPLLPWVSRELHVACATAVRRRTCDTDPASELDTLAGLLQY